MHLPKVKLWLVSRLQDWANLKILSHHFVEKVVVLILGQVFEAAHDLFSSGSVLIIGWGCDLDLFHGCGSGAEWVRFFWGTKRGVGLLLCIRLFSTFGCTVPFFSAVEASILFE
jgi:hypothetical protein